MNYSLATDEQLKNIIKYDIDCPPSLMKGIVLEMLDRGILNGYVVHIWNKRYGKQKNFKTSADFEFSDAIQLGLIGIWKATDKFKPGKSSFAKFAAYYIAVEWQNLARGQNAEKRTLDKELLSIDYEVNEEGQALQEFLPSYDNVERSVLMKMHFESQLKKLTKLQKVAILSYLKGYHNKETAKALNVTRQAVDNAFHRAVEKMGGERISLRENCGVKRKGA
ncbi:sigma-70 family RNA polymerase sigma factor [Metabacillus fastidiosus]|uniref:Sigma-70 family RNA polymerase sigma factor n=1 Tax=Metabacillus fastidiosus TaxID=1458 RepID=A0ABU6NSA5_9BACI|nr:sigma-70 family RNA polymerase sigma factor [Metabacillus fastidiosus]